MNPFLKPYKTPFETVPFDKIKTEHYLPAIREGIRQGKLEIDAIVNEKRKPTFKNTIEALEKSGALLDRVSTVFFNMNSAETNNEIQALAQEISPMLTDFSNDIMLNKELFRRVKTIYAKRKSLKLTVEQQTLLEKTYKGFIRNGANLNEKQKAALRAIDSEKSGLSLTFGENVLAESNAFILHITNKSDLAGLPAGAIEAAAMMAKEKGKKAGWVFTLDFPSYVPFLTYADNRDLREKMFKAFGSKGFQGNNRDNREIIKKIAALRHKRANLLGYQSHADFVLEERMAESPERVFDFLNSLQKNAIPFAKQELRELTAYAQSLGGPTVLQRWDFAYYSEKLKKEKFAINDELLKPYFKLENVFAGALDTATRLYGLKFVKRDKISVYHKDVVAYEVLDSKDNHQAILYADFFPRPGKRQGAWMTSFKSQWKENGINSRPHVSIVCNFTKPTATKPSMLTFNEVTTLFHEFGHALHGICANGKYQSLSGTSVYWDFVELPSQLMENWCYEFECLKGFAKHFKTGKPIPREYIEKIKQSANFLSGLATVRQLGLGFLDMAWHSKDPARVKDVKDFELKMTAKTDLFPPVKETITSCSFSHIFQGGYSSGYYSYKWAEVIEADAFEAFTEKGIFNQSVANSFRKNILSKGGSEHPALLYRRFRGRDADSKALLRKAGLLKK